MIVRTALLVLLLGAACTASDAPIVGILSLPYDQCDSVHRGVVPSVNGSASCFTVRWFASSQPPTVGCVTLLSLCSGSMRSG
jgi:hypothetical protein